MLNIFARNSVRYALLGVVIILGLTGCAGLTDTAVTNPDTKLSKASNTPAENPKLVQEGDLAAIHFKVHLADGALVYTSRPQEAEGITSPYKGLIPPPMSDEPVTILAGGGGPIPGLGMIVKGLRNGEQAIRVIPAQHAYGPNDPNGILKFPCRRTQPKTFSLSPKDYVQQFDAFPVVGDLVPVTPYYPAEVISVARDHVALSAKVEDGKVFDDNFGNTRLQLVDEEIHLVLEPVIGASFEYEGKKGRIVSYDSDQFDVDFNHPLAGQPLYVNLQVESIAKSSEFKDIHLDWVEDHDRGYQLSAEQTKPQVLVLYAKWCGWSKKLLTEALEDPRVKQFKDDFVWVKVDSDTERSYKEFYGQKGFPLTLILDPNGEIIQRLDGYKDGDTLFRALTESRRLLQSG